MMKPTSATTVKSKSTMYLNEESFHSNQGNIVRFLRSLVLSKNNSHGLGQGKLGKSRVFGRDLKLHLTETRQESKLRFLRILFSGTFWTASHATFLLSFFPVPPILRVCSKCIEHRGIVDGIYRLSGISSNIRALK